MKQLKLKQLIKEEMVNILSEEDAKEEAVVDDIKDEMSSVLKALDNELEKQSFHSWIDKVFVLIE